MVKIEPEVGKTVKKVKLSYLKVGKKLAWVSKIMVNKKRDKP